ncbi:hypothetical protein DSO57_1029158 [Entomophthora muscae]|uniref:Uncharacterized protein n=1 Tax=Entomophthora muscae TaxID=34485 RepID=A0ACC2RG05_9FUNG|nr:hypothetical protein DSO57_1029158 [Entomophthora muscae]
MIVIDYLPPKDIQLSKEQTRILENVFQNVRKPSKDMRLKLKMQLNLPISFVSSWFQARLMKHKRSLAKKKNNSTTPSSPRLPSFPTLQYSPIHLPACQTTDPSHYRLTTMKSNTTPHFCEDLRLPSLQIKPTIPKFKDIFF